ncbi:hypothetical protein [Streptomyces barkulensis]|uniref:hypothetical protein n=1 Tax=Streptomyces barkulensis TaxID=1257026 RepID=UPI00117C8EA4
MVPLAGAWDSGAHSWDAQRREAFANDLDAGYALIAVTVSTNRSKGDQDPAERLPRPPMRTVTMRPTGSPPSSAGP